MTARDSDGDTATLSFGWKVKSPDGDGTGTVLSVSPNPTTSENYTVSGAYTGTRSYIYFTLYETNPWGDVTPFRHASVPFTQAIANRLDGTYTYRLEGCYLKQYQNYPEAEEICEIVGDTLSVTVDGPDPDSVGAQLGYTFQARVNSTSPATATMLFIDRTSAATGGGVFQDIVLRKSGNAFELVEPGSVAGTSPGSWSTTTAVDLVLNDINLDGFVDVLVRGLGSAITGAVDQIVYAPGRTGGSPTILTAVGSSLKNFLFEVGSWTQNPMFFQQQTEPYRVRIYLYRKNCFIGESRRYCIATRIPVYENSGTVPTNKSPEAREFAKQFTTSNGEIIPDISFGSVRARAINEILERVFGTEVLVEILARGCTGNYVYDVEYSIPCSIPEWFWRIVLGNVLNGQTQIGGAERANPDENATPGVTAEGECRYLKSAEKQLPTENGFAIEAIDDVLVCRGGYRLFWGLWTQDPNTIAAPDGHVYVGLGTGSPLAWMEEYTTIADKSLLLHELHHVWEVRRDNLNILQVTVQSYKAKYFGGYIYMPIVENKAFDDYNVEQRAEMVQDRYRLRNSLRPYRTGLNENGSATPCRLEGVIPFGNDPTLVCD